MQRFFMIIMNLAFYHPIFSAKDKHTFFFMSKRAGSNPCSKGSYIASKPDCLGKSLTLVDFPVIPDKLSFLSINQLNTRKIHPPA